MDWVFWAMLGAAVLHVVEEYVFGWLDFTRGLEGRVLSRFTPGIDLAAFSIVNALFVLLCIAGALVGMDQPFFSLSIAALLLINTVMHLVPMAVVRRYSPGSATVVSGGQSITGSSLMSNFTSKLSTQAFSQSSTHSMTTNVLSSTVGV